MSSSAPATSSRSGAASASGAASTASAPARASVPSTPASSTEAATLGDAPGAGARSASDDADPGEHAAEPAEELVGDDDHQPTAPRKRRARPDSGTASRAQTRARAAAGAAAGAEASEAREEEVGDEPTTSAPKARRGPGRPLAPAGRPGPAIRPRSTTSGRMGTVPPAAGSAAPIPDPWARRSSAGAHRRAPPPHHSADLPPVPRGNPSPTVSAVDSTGSMGRSRCPGTGGDLDGRVASRPGSVRHGATRGRREWYQCGAGQRPRRGRRRMGRRL